ncbi:hypothetical protein PISMIDRAFT_686354 [Pisolithus microcarpus 441]|uniref:Uncharacterized protein n=1 Tax=Pisolithus microcarpus 441 TaxID=765257 RepID=A0A0C9YIA2_9AGAM|nr:hypothetical protein PISMIDRAFT_686354 [Pisolithus microcarpus 441]
MTGGIYCLIDSFAARAHQDAQLEITSGNGRRRSFPAGGRSTLCHMCEPGLRLDLYMLASVCYLTL